MRCATTEASFASVTTEMRGCLSRSVQNCSKRDAGNLRRRTSTMRLASIMVDRLRPPENQTTAPSCIQSSSPLMARSVWTCAR